MKLKKIFIKGYNKKFKIFKPYIRHLFYSSEIKILTLIAEKTLISTAFPYEILKSQKNSYYEILIFSALSVSIFRLLTKNRL